MTRSLLAAAAALLLAAPAAQAQAPSPRQADLAKPVVFVVGPEVPSSGTEMCTLFKPFVDELKRAKLGPTGSITWKGRDEHVRVAPTGTPCEAGGRSRLPAWGDGTLPGAARELGKQLQGIQGAGAVDVVAVGSAGLALRYALMMGDRARRGKPADGFPTDLRVEDAITVSTPHAGTSVFAGLCENGAPGSKFCEAVDAESDAGKPVFALLGNAAEQGRNPQGLGGTEWSVLAGGAERAVSVEQAVDMDAAHKTIYKNNSNEDKSTMLSMLADVARAKDDPPQYRYKHGAKEWAFSSAGKPAVLRMIDELAFGGTPSQEGDGRGGAYAPGCTGFNDLRSNGGDKAEGETVMKDPLVEWTGEKGDLRIVRTQSIDAMTTCWRKVGDGFESGTIVRINGIDVVPSGGAVIRVEPATRWVTSRGGLIKLGLPSSGADFLPKGRIEMPYPKGLSWRYPPAEGNVPITDGVGEVAKFDIDDKVLFGKEIGGGAALNTVRGGTQLDLNIALPGLFGGKVRRVADYGQCHNKRDDDSDGTMDRADPDCTDKKDDFEDPNDGLSVALTIGTTNTDGLRVEKIALQGGGDYTIGPFRGGAMRFSYNRQEQEVRIGAQASLALGGRLDGVELGADVAIKNGSLSALSGKADRLDVMLGSSGVFLQRFAFGVSGLQNWNVPGKPLEYQIGAGFSYLRRLAIFDNKEPLRVDGDLAITGSMDPWKWKLDGTAAVLGNQLATGSIGYEGGNGLSVAGTFGREFEVGTMTVEPRGKLAGLIEDAENMALRGDVTICGDAKIKGQDRSGCVIKASYMVSKWKETPLTDAFCFEVPVALVDEVKVGWVRRADAKTLFLPSYLWGNCDVAEYHRRAAPSQAGAPAGFTIPAGTPSQVVGVRGRGGRAVATLVGPGGVRVPMQADGLTMGEVPGGFVLPAEGDWAHVVLAKPAAGRWTVEPAPGTPEVAEVRTADVRPRPEVSARVARDRRGFVLRHRLVAQQGQEVRLVERAKGVERVVATTRGGRGAKRFRPAFGPAGRRQVVAVVLQDGRLREEQVLTSYVAPPPAAAGRVPRVRAKLRGDDLVLTWGRARGAGRGYAVEVTRRDTGSELHFVDAGKPRRVVLRDLTAAGRSVKVNVVAMRAPDGAPGPSRVVRPVVRLPKAVLRPGRPIRPSDRR